MVDNCNPHSFHSLEMVWRKSPRSLEVSSDLLGWWLRFVSPNQSRLWKVCLLTFPFITNGGCPILPSKCITTVSFCVSLLASDWLSSGQIRFTLLNPAWCLFLPRPLKLPDFGFFHILAKWPINAQFLQRSCFALHSAKCPFFCLKQCLKFFLSCTAETGSRLISF